MPSLPSRTKTMLLVLIAAGAAALYAASLRPVSIQADGRTLRLLSHAQTVGIALRDVGISLEAGDSVFPPAATAVTRGMTIRIERGHWVTIAGPKGDQRILAAPDTAVIPANLMLQAGLHLVPGDAVLADGLPVDPASPLARAPRELRLADKFPLELVRDGVLEQHEVAGPTVGDALWQLGVQPRAGDYLQPALDHVLSEDAPPRRIILRSARDIQVTADGQTVTLRTAAQTVGEALAQVGFALTDQDRSDPEEHVPVPADGRIRVIRVREVLLRQQTPVPFAMRAEYLADLELGTSRLIAAGSYGLKETTTRVRSEDGVETLRQQEGERTVLPPVDRVVGYGTKVVIRTATMPEGPIEYWYALKVYATAYWPCGSAGEPGKCYGHTASGKDLGLGMIAVPLDWYLKFVGDRVYVEGYGPATVEDDGANVRSDYWIDCAFPDYKTFLELGGSAPGHTTLYFLTPVPSASVIQFVANLPLK